MSVYPKQTTVQGSIFNPSLWIYDDVLGITTDFLNANYVKYPVAQSNCDFNGIENAGEQVINGILETYGDVIFNKTAVGSLTSLALQPPSSDSSTKIPTTAWVQTAITGGGGVAPNLSQVLLSGNSAGSTSINMNTNAITNAGAITTSGILTTTNAIIMNGGPTTATNYILTRQLSLKDATNGNNNGSSILTNSNVLTVDSVGASGTDTLTQFALRNTANDVITPLILTPTVNNMNVALDMTGSNPTLATIRSIVYGFRDIATGTPITTRIYQDNLALALDNTQLNSSIIFQTRTSANATVTPLSIGNTVNNMNVALDMTNTNATTFGYLNASVRARLFGLRDLTTSAITSCGMYFSSNILQIDSTSGSASTPTSMYLRTTKTDGTLTNALLLTNTTVKTDCYDVTALPTTDNSNTIPTTNWVQNVLTAYSPPSTIRRASSAGVFNPSGGNQIFNVNITGSGGLSISPPNLWLQDQGVTFRVNYFQSFNPLVGSPFSSQNYISFASTLTLYPFRFNTLNWLSTGGGGTPSQPRGRVSDNVITGDSGNNTNYNIVGDSFSPSGRQFWASDISFQSNGSFAGRLYIYGGATINDVVFLLTKPNGFQSANENYTYNFSIELLNQSNTVSVITSSGFNISNL